MQIDIEVPWEGEKVCPNEEAELVRAAQRDLAAFEPLYDRYRHRVYGYLYARLGDPDDAADLSQEVFLRALAALPHYRIGATPFGVWLFRIARNVATDLQRRQRPNRPWDALPDDLHSRDIPDLETQVIQRKALVRLHAILVDLDPGARELLILRFAARMTAAEIGAVIGKSPSATHMRLQRLVQRLKEQYHDSHP